MENFNLQSNQKIASGFKEPAGYFDVLPEKIAEKISRPGVISIFSNKMRFIYAAAAVIVIALCVPIFQNNEDQSVDSATLEEYLAYNSELNSDDLLSGLDISEIEQMEQEIKIDDQAIEETLLRSGNIELLLIE